MLRFICTILLSLYVAYTSVQAQTFSKPSVPDVIDFAGMKLELSSAAKKKIEADVTMIYGSAKYLQQKIDRANLYFPIIEHVFHDEGFPEEFKYLALQESSLVSDAVSSSNAVGFWQFKKETAIEVGVNVNASVDERMHIVYASRGAAKYLKKNNLLLDNWIYALLSYNVGPGGVKSHVKSKYVGAKCMMIEDDMHWYVIRFLAYKIAYQDLIGKANHPELSLIEYSGIKNKSLADIAKQAKVDYELVKEYNKWCIKGQVPGDKEYTVLIPASHGTKPSIEKQTPVDEKPVVVTTNPALGTTTTLPKSFPDIRTFADSASMPVFVSINKVKAIRATKGDDINSLAVKAGLAKQAFLYFNEMKGFETVSPGSFYYLQLKKTKALVSFHTVSKGETIQSIAQKYAVTTASIRKHNRMSKNEFVKENRVLWLRATRPKTTPIEYKPTTPRIEETKTQPKEKVVESPVEKDVIPEGEVQIDSTLAIYHVVQSGETVFGISRKYAIDSDSIRAWNHLSGYSIQVNQKLIVGFKHKEIKKKEIIHTVQAGETVYKISKQYNVSTEEIKSWNNMPDFTLKLGQQLKIYLP
ncbi:MAG: LysM peptidoglycan-binding domain-containing protein [Cytophaga sp.]|uniref:LysM peptidoglycan-binding domain-containing protein n=1 Tax=Cytophaga sp. TaxID=29535 RepID=UPI003F818C3E